MKLSPLLMDQLQAQENRPTPAREHLPFNTALILMEVSASFSNHCLQYGAWCSIAVVTLVVGLRSLAVIHGQGVSLGLASLQQLQTQR